MTEIKLPVPEGNLIGPSAELARQTIRYLRKRIEELERDAEASCKSQRKMSESHEAGLKSVWTVATRGWIFYHFEHAGNARWEECGHCVCQTAYAEFTQRHLDENALLKSVLDLKGKLQRYRELAEMVERYYGGLIRHSVASKRILAKARELRKEDGDARISMPEAS